MAAVASSIIALGGLAITATTTGISMAQQAKSRDKMLSAEAAATKAMAEARKRLDVNYQEASSISKDPYTMAIEASLQQGANAVGAMRETQRGAANVAGIQVAQNQNADAVRVAYGQELQAREQRIIDEESRLRDVNTQLDLGEVEGAQLAAARAEDMMNEAGADAMEGFRSMGQQGLAMAPLFSESGNVRNDNRMMKSFMKANPNGTQADYQKSLFGQNKSLGGADFSGVGSMNPTQYGSWMSQQNEGAMRQARQNFNPNFQAPRPQIIPTVDIFGTQVPGGTQSPYYNYNF
tara:strand:+ start:1553 stop:2431 length:879 start_codon:yes stop_codon:yes gene_type:complete